MQLMPDVAEVPFSSSPPLIIDAMACTTASKIKEAKSIVIERFATRKITYVISRGEDNKHKKGPRKMLYKIIKVGDMPIAKVLLYTGDHAFVSFNDIDRTKKLLLEFYKFGPNCQTYECLWSVLMYAKAGGQEAPNEPTGENRKMFASPSTIEEVGAAPGLEPSSWSGQPASNVVSQRLPDYSNNSSLPSGSGSNRDIDPPQPAEQTTQSAFPTDARERQKAREKDDKEKGIVRKINKLKKVVEDHYDDCGESVDCLLKELRALGDSEEVFLTVSNYVHKELPDLHLPTLTEASFFTGKRPIRDTDPRYVYCVNV